MRDANDKKCLRSYAERGARGPDPNIMCKIVALNASQTIRLRILHFFFWAICLLPIKNFEIFFFNPKQFNKVIAIRFHILMCAGNESTRIAQYSSTAKMYIISFIFVSFQVAVWDFGIFVYASASHLATVHHSAYTQNTLQHNRCTQHKDVFQCATKRSAHSIPLFVATQTNSRSSITLFAHIHICIEREGEKEPITLWFFVDVFVVICDDRLGFERKINNFHKNIKKNLKEKWNFCCFCVVATSFLPVNTTLCTLWTKSSSSIGRFQAERASFHIWHSHSDRHQPKHAHTQNLGPKSRGKNSCSSSSTTHTHET